MSFYHKKKIVAVLSAFMLTVACTSCSAKKEEGPRTRIAVICKSTDAYWDSVKKAVQDAGEEMNLDVSYTAPEKEDYEKQIELINQAVNEGAQAIVVAPVVLDELNNTLSAVIQRGIPVLTIDSDISLEQRACCISTQNEAAAASAGRYVLDMADNDSVIAVVTHDTISQTAMQRLGGFMDVFMSDEDTATADIPAVPEERPDGEDEEYDMTPVQPVEVKITGPQLLEPINCEGDINKTEEAVTTLLTENPEIDIIYATNQPTTIGVCQAVDKLVTSGAIPAGQVQVVGFDYFDGADKYLDNGVLSAVVVQNPYNMGYFGVRFAIYLLQGKEVSPTMDTGASLVTSENLGNKDIQFMIHPTS